MSSVNDPVGLNVAGVRELIGSKVNKIPGDSIGTGEGPVSEAVDILTLDLDDEELLALSVEWRDKYRVYETKIKERQDANKKYYLGRQLEGTQYNAEFPISANLLFEAEETFLPAALAKNPEPVVWSDDTTEGNEVAEDVKTMLQFHADVLVLRQKLALMTRHWSIYYLGCIKHGWDKKIKDIKSEVRLPQNLILDPDGAVDVYGDFDGYYIGEKITTSAKKLIEMFPKHKEDILVSVKNKKGTQVTYTEWWTDEFCFYTYQDIVLDKHKNQFFNHPEESEETDEEGNVDKVMKDGKNHFAAPKKPYTFLSVFTLGEQPHDVTSLIEQNIPNQNLITKRTTQIDANLSRQNNSIAFSEDNFNQQTAKQAANAFEKGNPVLVPKGRPIAEAITRFPAQPYPEAAFKELEENKNNLRMSFGVQGTVAQQQNEETTARGMILNQQRDSTRIGGGIGDRLEQVADNVCNWWVQLYYVFYDEEHFGAVLGGLRATQFATFSNQDLTKKLVVSVASGSMKPRDEVTEMNQAIQLYEMEVLDPKTLLTILKVPDVQKTTENTILWLTDKPTYMMLNFPELMKEIQSQQQQQGQPGQPGLPGQPQTPNTPGQVPPTDNPNLTADPASAALSQVELPK